MAVLDVRWTWHPARSFQAHTHTTMTGDGSVRLSAEHWREVFAAADRALALSATERDAFIQEYTRKDPALGAELEALLASGEGESALDSPAAVFAETLLDSTPAELDHVAATSRIGPYRIVGLIGRGGMGAVYLAERADDQYRKRVALKLLPSWSAADEHRVRRFIEERQILAALEHPDIARLLDGGVTPDGLPWFAMEYVEGTPIDKYCDERKLSIEHRLQLFCRVCQAVEYAHRNLVVHRDLKPANILVRADGTVKLLDFGIAKLLNDEAASRTAELTQTHERFMTPLFASPEQVRGETASTASDVYALGVLLYGLLAGRGPYRIATAQPHEVARAVLEQEPELPSAAVLQTAGGEGIARRLRGDLDAIVLKAMEKDQRRRYASVEQLEADVRRYLAGIPVVARPATRLYRAWKFLGRHRVAIAVGSAVATLTIGLLGVAIWESASSAFQRGRANAANSRLEGTLLRAIQSAGAGQALSRRDLLDKAVTIFEQEPVSTARAQFLLTIGQIYSRIGEPERARDLLGRSITLSREGDQPQALARALSIRGGLLAEAHDLAAAEKDYRDALQLDRRAFGERHSEVARTLNGLAAVRVLQQRFVEAESLSRNALSIDSAQSGGNRGGIARSLRGLGSARLAQGDYGSAAKYYSDALSLLPQKNADDSLVVAETILDLATALKGKGDPPADSLYLYGLQLQRRAAAASLVASQADADWLHALRVAAPSVRQAGGTFDSRIVFTAGPVVRGINGLGYSEVFVMNPDGSDRRQLTHTGGLAEAPTISSDGTRVAYSVGFGERRDIFVMDIDNGVPRQVTHLSEMGRAARAQSWSPDGTQLIFRIQGDRSIYLTNVDGTGFRKLAGSHPRAFRPAWSPKGDQIAFIGNRDGPPDIYVMSLDGTNQVRLTVNAAKDTLHAEWFLRPAWSPDGNRIAYASDVEGNRDIYVMNKDGSGITRLTDDPREDVYPTWSPDGRQIAFMSRRESGINEIFIMNDDGTGQRIITEASSRTFSGFPSWGIVPRTRSSPPR
jgi:serine/threonine-protein kinase